MAVGALRGALLALLVATPLATPLAAQEVVTPEAFRDYAEGWTLHFELDGRPFGAETYHRGGDVIWKPEGGQCAPGVWAPADSDGTGGVCFLYDGAFACWRLFRDARGLFAIPSDAKAPLLRVVRRSRAPVACGDVPAV